MNYCRGIRGLTSEQCTAERPKCAQCKHRDSDCEYIVPVSSKAESRALKRRADDLQSAVDQHEELYSLLRSKSDDEAGQILKCIRAGQSVDSVVRLVKDGDLLLQLSLRPETRYQYDFPYIRDI